MKSNLLQRLAIIAALTSALLIPIAEAQDKAPTFGLQVFDDQPKPGQLDLGGIGFKSEVVLKVDSTLAKKGKALTKDGAAQLRRLAGTILVGRTVQSVRVIGYTDSIGSKEKNQKRGLQYAKTVRASLYHNGVPLDLIKAESLGESDPLASNLESSGRSENRRVKVIIVGLREPNLADVVAGKAEAATQGAYIAADPVERVTLVSKSLFNDGTAKINGDGEFALEQLANKLRDEPGWSELVIIGHSQRVKSEQFSKLQAQAVLEYLVDHGIDTRNALALGLGNAVPANSNKKDSRNERVVIEIHRD